ncbi:MAG: hypothetical protein QGH73_01610 [Rhodospirillales bacterium]|nr:hypothetical protein [Rhodospirillales bacterium]MDP6643677.1 hypothetical protein [Rhodospirillales bacterium]MDP6840356.1 hypothetical protein [Rhodospirillales bacterium]
MPPVVGRFAFLADALAVPSAFEILAAAQTATGFGLFGSVFRFGFLVSLFDGQIGSLLVTQRPPKLVAFCGGIMAGLGEAPVLQADPAAIRNSSKYPCKVSYLFHIGIWF